MASLDFGDSGWAIYAQGLIKRGVKSSDIPGMMPYAVLKEVEEKATIAGDKQLVAALSYLLRARKAADDFLKSGKPHVDKEGKAVFIPVPDS
tara:strand:- start:575 stop:850 length:276 start_codon:yes stop_codon:yes gene_type:complete